MILINDRNVNNVKLVTRRIGEISKAGKANKFDGYVETIWPYWGHRVLRPACNILEIFLVTRRSRWHINDNRSSCGLAPAPRHEICKGHGRIALVYDVGRTWDDAVTMMSILFLQLIL
jgi:hypothetical protein